MSAQDFQDYSNSIEGEEFDIENFSDEHSEESFSSFVGEDTIFICAAAQ